MRTVQDWLDEYGESHRNPTNERIHWICVPLIALSLLGVLWALPFPEKVAAAVPWLNWATLLVAGALAYYAVLSPALALGMFLFSVASLLVVGWMAQMADMFWLLWVAVFVGAWAGQFVGHRIEGRKPSFFKDIQFLLIGPLWLLSFIYRRAGLPYR